MSSQKSAAATVIDDDAGELLEIRQASAGPATARSAHASPSRLAAGYSHAMLTVARSGAVLAALALPFSTPVTNVALGFAFAGWLLCGRLFELIRAASRHPVAQGAVVLLILLIAGVAWSEASAVQSADAIAKYRKLLLLVMLIPILDTPWWRRAVLIAFFSSLLVLLCVSMAIYAGLPGMPAADPLQGAVVLRNHITHGFMMALLAIAAVIWGLTTSDKRVRTAAWVIVVLAMVNALAMTYARTGYLTFAALILAACAFRYRSKGLVAGLAVILLGAALAYVGVASVQKRVDRAIIESRDFAQGQVVSPTGIRLHYYQRALEIVRDHPVLGAGTGSWPVEYERRSAADPLQLRRVSGMGNPHSEYLLTAVQWGSVGLLLHLAALVALMRGANRLPTRRAWLARGVIVAFAVGSLFNSFFWDATEGHALILLVAALYGGGWPPDRVDL